MAGWHHRLDGREFEQALGDSEGQGSLACCGPCGSQKVKLDLVSKQQKKQQPISLACHQVVNYVSSYTSGKSFYFVLKSGRLTML